MGAEGGVSFRKVDVVIGCVASSARRYEPLYAAVVVFILSYLVMGSIVLVFRVRQSARVRMRAHTHARDGTELDTDEQPASTPGGELGTRRE